jgi:eukaryotic-like serine/threonine-protein kinase
MPITLTVIRGPHRGKVFTLDRHDTFVVGRARDAHLYLPDDPYFSRNHFLIEANPPLCSLADLNSRNGTLLNSARVNTAELHDGDELSGGQTALRVSVSPEPDCVTLDLPQPAPVHGALSQSTPREPHTVAQGNTPPIFESPVGRAGRDEYRPPNIPGLSDYVEIGRGGMGIVYRAIRSTGGTPVAHAANERDRAVPA